MWERFAPRMRRVITVALDEAGRSGAPAVEARHLLLAVARDRQSAGAYLLEQCGVPLDPLLARIASSSVETPISMRADRFHPTGLLLLNLAAGEAERHQHAHVGTEHLALALSHRDDLDVGRIVREMGLLPDQAEKALQRWIDQAMPRRRNGFLWRGFRSPVARAAAMPVQKFGRAAAMVYKIYAQKSIGHPKYVTDPYPLYAWLRQRCPVRKDPIAPVWILTRYEELHQMLRDNRFRKDPFASERLPRVMRKQLGATEEVMPVDSDVVSMLFLDPPNHTRVRAAFARAFSPRVLAEMRPRIEQIALERVDRCAKSGKMDIIADLAYPLPVIVIAELLGFPVEDYPKIKRWSDDFAASLSLNAGPAAQATAAQARREIRAYFDALVAHPSQTMQQALIGRLLAAEGDPGGLSREEIFSNCVLLLAAGHETTTNLIGNGMLALMRNLDQWRLLVEKPELMESAVEEILRYDPPVQWTTRMAGEEIALGGQKIAAGDILLGAVGAANRDPEKFPDPERFDIRRNDNSHLSFGVGIHYCLGASLARMETETVLRLLTMRFPRMRLATRRIKWIKGLTFRGVKQLPVTLR
jgi:cytochrome P450